MYNEKLNELINLAKSLKNDFDHDDPIVEKIYDIAKGNIDVCNKITKIIQLSNNEEYEDAEILSKEVITLLTT
jgi:hypothetical protein